VVLAVTVPALQALVEASPDLGEPGWRRAIAAQRLTYPFAVWRLWLDGRLQEGRAPFVGTTGVGVLDNISLYHLFEDESRDWSARHDGAVVELHAYAVDPEADEASLRKDMLKALYHFYPETEPLRILDQLWLLRQDCPAFVPGGYALRPGVETPYEGVTLAGDFVQLPIPSALMERAAASGFLAANTLLHRFGVRPEPIESVPLRGILARLPLG
jgi:isorenieratene synthase